MFQFKPNKIKYWLSINYNSFIKDYQFVYNNENTFRKHIFVYIFPSLMPKGKPTL